MVLSPIYFRQPLSAVDRMSIVENLWQQEDEAVFAIVEDKLKALVIGAYIEATPLTKKQRTKIIRLLNALAKENFQARLHANQPSLYFHLFPTLSCPLVRSIKISNQMF